MRNIWRQQPSGRLVVNNFVKRTSTDQTPIIATTFFEEQTADRIIKTTSPTRLGRELGMELGA